MYRAPSQQVSWMHFVVSWAQDLNPYQLHWMHFNGGAVSLDAIAEEFGGLSINGLSSSVMPPCYKLSRGRCGRPFLMCPLQNSPYCHCPNALPKVHQGN